MLGNKNKNKIGFFSAKTSKKVADSREPLDLRIGGMGGMPLDGMIIDGIIRKESLIQEEIEEKTAEEKIDNRKRTFLKTAGVAGIGLAASTLLPKSAEAYVAGSTPTSNVVGLKNAANTRINPATEDTSATLLKTSDLTFDAGAVEVKVTSMPASGGTSAFSDASDVDQKGLVDGDRHVQVDVLSSALPTSASTETTLQTISFGGVKYS